MSKSQQHADSNDRERRLSGPGDDTRDCGLCEKENSILSVTGMQIPVGERCYTKLITKDVIWNQETKLKKLEEVVRIGQIDKTISQKM